MRRDAAETAILDAASNYGKVGTATGIINTAVGGATALAGGINEIAKNQGRGYGGTPQPGKRSQMEMALDEHPPVRDSRGGR